MLIRTQTSLTLCLSITMTLSLIAADTKPATDTISLWDTARGSATSISPAAVLTKPQWNPMTGDTASFTGDACIVNQYLALVLRRGANGAEVYYRLGDDFVKGPTLVPLGLKADTAKAITSFRLLDHTSDSYLLEATAATQSGTSISGRYLIKKGKPFVETAPGPGAEKILVEMSSPHVVVPDLFGADLVVTAKDTPASRLRLPSESMLLAMAGDGNAIIQCAWRSNQQGVTIGLQGDGATRMISSAEIEYKKDLDMRVTVGVLAAPAIWHQKNAGELNAVKFTKLDWQMPYPALWRANYRRTDNLIDSWKLVIKKDKPGQWEGFGISLKKEGTVWHPARGTFGYPAQIEQNAAYLRTPKFEPLKELKYKPDAMIVIYPFQNTGATPKTAYSALEFLREALAETPEFTRPDDMQVKVLARSRYPGVCGTTDEVEKIFHAKEERAKKRQIIERFTRMNYFNVVVRMRIQEYMDWSQRTRELCATEKAQHPHLSALANEIEQMAARCEAAYAKHKLADRTPAASHVLVEKFIALVDSNEDKKDEHAKQLGRDLRTIASNQDNALGVFRMIAKEMRQSAGYRMLEAKDEAAFRFAWTIRQRTAEVLQNTLGVESGLTD